VPEDGPSRVFRARVQRLEIDPPPPDWKGEWTLHEKMIRARSDAVSPSAIPARRTTSSILSAEYRQTDTSKNLA
jgi:hypothetical protein